MYIKVGVNIQREIASHSQKAGPNNQLLRCLPLFSEGGKLDGQRYHSLEPIEEST